MRLSRAYFTSLSTTAILVAGSLLLLAVTSAIVTFDGWPGDAGNASVDRVTVNAPAVAAEPVAATTGAASRAAARAAVVAVRLGGGGAAGGPTGGLTPTAPGDLPANPLAPTAPAAPGSGITTVTATSTTGRAAPGSGGGSAPRAGDPVRAIGERVDNAVAPVSPQAGHGVAQLSDTVAGVVDSVAPTSLTAGR